MNFYRLTKLILLALILAHLGCALPVPIGSELSGFVPSKELHVVSLAREGMALFNSSRYFEAEARFRKALYLDPSLSNIKFNLATTLERTGFYDEARDIYEELIKKEGDKVEYRAAYGRLLASMGKYDAAKEEFLKALVFAKDEEDEKLLNVLTKSLITIEYSSGDNKAAVCNADELASRTGTIEDLRQYVRLLLSVGRAEKADSVMSTLGFLIDPNDSLVSLYLKTLIAYDLSQNEKALLICERAISSSNIDPTIDFEVRIVNLLLRYAAKEPGILEREESINILKILDESVSSSPLTTIYWSPKLLEDVVDFLATPEVRELIED